MHGQEVYITDIHRLDMVHILYIMLNFDEVYISDIQPAVSIATWYIYIYIYPCASSDSTATLHDYLPRAKALGN